MSVTKAEARRRIRQAQEILEFKVQAGLSEACNALSRITHCPEYDKVGELYDKVKSLWHQLESRTYSTKIDLDSEAAAKFLKEKS
jgi:hypothetical protein